MMFIIGLLTGVGLAYLTLTFYIVKETIDVKRQNELERQKKLEALRESADFESSVNYRTFQNGKLDIKI